MVRGAGDWVHTQVVGLAAAVGWEVSDFMLYTLEHIVALINRKEPLPATFSRALTEVCHQALHRGIYPIEVQKLFADLSLELPASFFSEPDGIIKCAVWYKVVRVLERSGISVVPLSVPLNLSIYQSVYLLKRPDITSDEDIATLQRLVAEHKSRHTNGELEAIARAKEKLSNYNIMLRVFEYLGAAQMLSLDANQRSVLQNILSEHPLPHDGVRYVRSLYSYACDIGSYHYDYSDPKFVLPQLPAAENATALQIVARTIAPSHHPIEIPDNFPFKSELDAAYAKACPIIFTRVETEEAPRRPLSLRPLSEINAPQRERRLENRLERVLEPLKAASASLTQLQETPLVRVIAAHNGAAFDWEDRKAVALACKLQAAKQHFDAEQRRLEEEQEAQEAQDAAALAAALAAQKKSRNKRKKDAPVVSDAAKVIAEAVRAAAKKKADDTPATPVVAVTHFDYERTVQELQAEQQAEQQDAELQSAAPQAAQLQSERYYENLAGVLPPEVDSEQVAQLMQVKGVRTGYSADFIAQVATVLKDRDLSTQLELLAQELHHDDAARLMLPDFSKTQLHCFFNGYELEPGQAVALPTERGAPSCNLDLSAEVNALLSASHDQMRELLPQAQNTLYEAYLAAIEERYAQEQQAQQSLEHEPKKRRGLLPSNDPTRRRKVASTLVDPNDFGGTWSGAHLGPNFEDSVNQVNENKIAFGRHLNQGELSAQLSACALGAIERFHLVPWVWDELTFLNHSYLVWSEGGAPTAESYPDLNQDYGVNLKQFVLDPFAQTQRFNQVLCYELVLRPFFAPWTEESTAAQVLALMHYNISAHQNLDVIPAAFYHGFIYFDHYLQHPEAHVNLERFYLAVAKANPYALTLFMARVVGHFGPKLKDIPEQFFELIVLNLVLFVDKEHASAAEMAWYLLSPERSGGMSLNVLALRLMARTLYGLVHTDPSFRELELTQVSHASLGEQLKKQSSLIAKMRKARLRVSSAAKHEQAYALLLKNDPQYCKNLTELTINVAAAELKQAGFRLETEHSTNPRDNAEFMTMVIDVVQNYLTTGELPKSDDEPTAPERTASAAELKQALQADYGSEELKPRYQANHLSTAEESEESEEFIEPLPDQVSAEYAERFGFKPKAHLECGPEDTGAVAPMALGAARVLLQVGKKKAHGDFLGLGGVHAPVVSSARSANALAAQAQALTQPNTQPSAAPAPQPTAQASTQALAEDFFDLEVDESEAESETSSAPSATAAAPAAGSPFAEFFDDDAAIAAQAQAERRAARSAHKGMGALEAGELEQGALMGSSFLAQAMNEGLKALQAAGKEEQAQAAAAVLPIKLSERAQSIIATALKSALSVLPRPKMEPSQLQQAEDEAVLLQLFAEHKDWIYGMTAKTRVGLNPCFAHRLLAWSQPEFNALPAQVAPLCTKYVAPLVRRILCANEERFYTLTRITDLTSIFNLEARRPWLKATIDNPERIRELPSERLFNVATIYGFSYNRLLLNMVLYGMGPLGSWAQVKDEFGPCTLNQGKSLETFGRARFLPSQGSKAPVGDPQARVGDPQARVAEWRHKLRLSQQTAPGSDGTSEVQLDAQQPISLFDCLSAYLADGQVHQGAFWAQQELPRTKQIEQYLRAATTSAALGFSSGILAQEMLDLGRICEDNFGLCLVPSPSVFGVHFSFKHLRPAYRHVRCIVIEPELLVTAPAHAFYLRLKATLYYAYLALELTCALGELKNPEGLVRILARAIVRQFVTEGYYHVERLVLEYLQGAFNVIAADGSLSYDDLMHRTLHLYEGYDVRSLDLHAKHILQLQRFFALGASYSLGQNYDREAQLRYVNLLVRLSLTPAPTSDCQQKAHPIASMVSSYFFTPQANENLLRSGIFWNLKSYHEPERLVLDAEKIRSKLLESAQVQDVITKLRAEESGVDESGPTLDEALARKQAAAAPAAPKDAAETPSVPAAPAAPAELGVAAAEPAAKESETVDAAVAGLNPKLHKVIEALAVQATDAMVYSEFNGICVSYGLLSGNYAIEVLNEFSYEHYDEPLLELDGSGNSAIIYLSVELIAKLYEECRKLKA